MLYCIYSEDGFNSYSYLGRDKAFVEKLVNSYLKAEGESIINGKTYGVGGVLFQVYETTLKNDSEIEGVINRQSTLYHRGNFNSDILDELFKNVTANFLKGRGWGDLKDDLYNVYLNIDGKKKIKTTVENDELLSFIERWQQGETSGWLEGSEVSLIKPTTFQVYDIDFEFRMKNKGETKKLINSQVRNLYRGEWSTFVLEQFGKNVTSKFKIGPYGSKKKPLIHAVKPNSVTANKDTGRIFISHSSKDKAIVTEFTNEILILCLGAENAKIFCTSIEGLGITSGQGFSSTH